MLGGGLAAPLPTAAAVPSPTPAAQLRRASQKARLNLNIYHASWPVRFALVMARAIAAQSWLLVIACTTTTCLVGTEGGWSAYLGLQAMHDMCKECLKSGGGCLHRRPCTFSEVFSELPLVALLTSFCAIIVLLRAGPCLVRPNSPISGLHYAQQAPSVYIKNISSLCQVGQALFVRL